MGLVRKRTKRLGAMTRQMFISVCVYVCDDGTKNSHTTDTAAIQSNCTKIEGIYGLLACPLLWLLVMSI